MVKRIDTASFYKDTMEMHREKLILERTLELEQLRKRVKYLEQELQGMGVRDYSFNKGE